MAERGDIRAALTTKAIAAYSQAIPMLSVRPPRRAIKGRQLETSGRQLLAVAASGLTPLLTGNSRQRYLRVVRDAAAGKFVKLNGSPGRSPDY